jgi:hypothetical protein
MKNVFCSRVISWFPGIRTAIAPATSGNSCKFLGRVALSCAAAIALTSLPAGAVDYSNWLKNLSASGDPTALYSHTKVKIATSGNYVHVAWFGSQIASPYGVAIFYTRSTDGGLTFETPRILVSGAGNMVTFDATFNNLAADGAFVHIVYREGWPEKLQYLRSADNGANFEAVRTLSEGVTPVGTYSYYKHTAYLTAGNGKLAVAWSYESNSGGAGAFNSSYSSDNGATFATTTFTNTLYSFAVVDAVRSGDYVYVLTSTGDAGGGYGYYTGRFYLWASWNGGASFRPPVKVTVPTTDDTPVDMVCPIQNGIYSSNLVASGATVNIVWINEDTYVSTYNRTYTLRTCRSTDGGLTLNAPATLHSFAAGDGTATNAGMETIAGSGDNLYITTVLGDAPVGTYTWRSTDAGATWGAAQRVSTVGSLPITKVDPSDAMRVHTVNSFYFQSMDSGATFDGGVNPHTPISDWTTPQMTVDATGVVHYAANSGYYGEIFYRRLAAPPQPGSTNKALACVGNGTQNDNMQVAASPDLNFTTAMTVEFWARRDTDDTNTAYFQPLVGKKRLPSANGSYGVGAWSSSQVYARIVTDQSADNNGSLLYSGVSMAKGAWYHVALTYDASLATDNVKLFVNGVQKAQANLKGTILTDTMDSPLKVGNSSGTGGFSIDELRLWNKPLAGTEIASGMNYTRSGLEDGLVAYYDFNDTTMDITGRGNDGILMFKEAYTASAAPVTDATTRIIGMSGNLTFGNVKVGSTANATMTVSNTGNSPLTVSGINYPAGFTGNWASGTIAAGGSQDVTVTFTPSAAQPYSGTITVSSDATSGTNTIAASGQGTQTALEAWQAANFTAGEISGGSAAPATDFEHDGMANLLEYAFAKNPKVADLTGIAPNVSVNKMQISFRCDASCTDITYIVQSSPTLSAGSWTEIARSTGGAKTVDFTGSGCEISDTGTGVRPVTVTEKDAFTGKRFLRVKVTSP